MASRGLPVGDMRGIARIMEDVSLGGLALDRGRGGLRPSRDDRSLLALHVDGAVDWVAGYVPGTNVLETTGRSYRGELRVVDFMPVAEGRPGQGEAIAAGRFVRLVTCTEGMVSFRVACAVAFDGEPDVVARSADGWHVACSRPFTFAGDLATVDVSLDAGESIVIVLSEVPVAGGPASIAHALHDLGDTIHYWTWWSDRCRYKGDDFEAVLRDALAIKLRCGMRGMHLDEPGAPGFALAPIGDIARAAAHFLELGYRQEAAELLAWVYENGLSGPRDDAHGRWSFDEHFVETLDRYVVRYGTSGLAESLRVAISDTSLPPPGDLVRAS